ncbi:tol-pal system YbgF family protein [Novosphingobium aquiterrae]|uniref:Tol-pal system YbgF family protein n=1 Tax=Novosphingobium aquiterrae TaxID=624388 RepID=A0ABV6PK54_9SPHN
MTLKLRAARPVLLTLVLALAAPAFAQSTPANVDTRLRAVEAEVKALQRTVFPGGDGKYFPPQVQPGQTAAPAAGTPASTPVSDLLARMDAVEAQMARLTAQGEENANRLAKLEAKLAAGGTETAVTAAPAATGTENGATTNTNLAAMTGGAAAAPKPAATTASALATATTTKTATTPAKPAAAPSSRVAAVKAIQKPATSDAGDDEYSYGYRLFDAKFYPEAQQQLKMFLQKYPKHARVSYARNLLGRAYLDDNNPREAASWFLQNYQAGRKGDRAPDSLLYLAEAMRQLKDSTRACVALTQFGEDYAAEAAGRLKGQYDAIRATVKCN